MIIIRNPKIVLVIIKAPILQGLGLEEEPTPRTDFACMWVL